MFMPHLNRDRFLRVLALAESDKDGEALSAIRKAAAMARACGLSLGEAAAKAAGNGVHDRFGNDGVETSILKSENQRLKDDNERLDNESWNLRSDNRRLESDNSLLNMKVDRLEHSLAFSEEQLSKDRDSL